MSDRAPTKAEAEEAERKIQEASAFSCRWCGRRFVDIEAVYGHIDAEHPEKGGRDER